MDAVFLDPNPSSFALELRVIDPLEDLLGSYFYLFPTFPDGFFTPWEEKRPLFFSFQGHRFCLEKSRRKVHEK